MDFQIYSQAPESSRMSWMPRNLLCHTWSYKKISTCGKVHGANGGSTTTHSQTIYKWVERLDWIHLGKLVLQDTIISTSRNPSEIVALFISLNLAHASQTIEVWHTQATNLWMFWSCQNANTSSQLFPLLVKLVQNSSSAPVIFSNILVCQIVLN